jgi:hypothetical protein
MFDDISCAAKQFHKQAKCQLPSINSLMLATALALALRAMLTGGGLPPSVTIDGAKFQEMSGLSDMFNRACVSGFDGNHARLHLRTAQAKASRQ